MRRLKEIPYENFSVTLKKIDKASWNSTEYDYMFKVTKQEIMHPDSCHSGAQSNVVNKTKTNDILVVPCLNSSVHSFENATFASLVRTADETQVKTLLIYFNTLTYRGRIENYPVCLGSLETEKWF